ncbi:hypothetical protein B0J18DRAFT_266556 [Chaetomium sp. MPI-SDFR-AT-0129]|nr:hypothetical protein B0J18DRAFT_266556 [Chaetomium sp. MPI-SDFR-AT-0129]
MALPGVYFLSFLFSGRPRVLTLGGLFLSRFSILAGTQLTRCSGAGLVDCAFDNAMVDKAGPTLMTERRACQKPSIMTSEIVGLETTV